MSSTLCRRVLAFFFLALPAAAQNFKLNGPLARQATRQFGVPVTSPDGERVVYSTFVQVVLPNSGYSISELYSVSTRSKQGPVRLRDTGPGISRVQVTREGKNVLYLEGDAWDTFGHRGITSLATVPIDGSGMPVVLSDPLHYVQWFQESSDGVHVLYLGSTHWNGAFELYSVLLTGVGVPVQLNGELVPGGGVSSFAVSNDGRLAVYSADQDTNDHFELFVVPTDGSQPARKLPVPFVTGGNVALFAFDSDASHILYVADQEEDERYELFSVRTDGSQAPDKLNGPLAPGGSVGTRYDQFFYPFFTLTPDRRWVVYSADQEEDERFELYSVPVDGSRSPVKLSSPTDREVQFVALSYDSAWAIYQSDPSATDTYDLFSVPIDGSAPSRRISGPMVREGGISFSTAITFDSRRVVYVADQDTDEVRELYSAPIDGSAPPVKLNARLPPDGDVGVNEYSQGFWVMADGVLYLADQEQDELFELYFSPFSGGDAAYKIAAGPVHVVSPSQSSVQSPPLDFGKAMFARENSLLAVGVEAGARPRLLAELELELVGDVRDFQLAPSGDHVVYRALEEGDEGFQSYSARTSERPGRARFHPELSILWPPRLVPDGSRLVFLARPAPGGILGLYSAPADGSGTASLLSDSLGVLTIGTFVLSPDGLGVAFLARVSSSWSLFSAPVDGGSPAIQLSASLPAGWSVSTGMNFSADGSRIAFLSGGPGGSKRLYTVPSNGSSPAVSVYEAQAIWDDYRFADADRVVFRTTVDRKDELFVVPVDGSASPMRLNGPLPARGGVAGFALASCGTRAVYRAVQTTGSTSFELFGVPTDGSAPPVRLHAALPAGRDVRDFEISSDGRHVVYRADSLADEQLDLFSVPIDASRSPLRLNGRLVSGGNVSEYRISPDGKRVVYMADQEKDEVVELYSAPIQGSRGRTKLSRPLVPGGDADSFQISADSRAVAFTAQRNAAGSLTLLTVPIGGQGKATELAGPFQGDGSVSDYRIGADGGVVAYIADQEQSGVLELFAARRGTAPAVPSVIGR